MDEDSSLSSRHDNDGERFSVPGGVVMIVDHVVVCELVVFFEHHCPLYDECILGKVGILMYSPEITHVGQMEFLSDYGSS